MVVWNIELTWSMVGWLDDFSSTLLSESCHGKCGFITLHRHPLRRELRNHSPASHLRLKINFSLRVLSFRKMFTAAQSLVSSSSSLHFSFSSRPTQLQYSTTLNPACRRFSIAASFHLNALFTSTSLFLCIHHSLVRIPDRSKCPYGSPST